MNGLHRISTATYCYSAYSDAKNNSSRKIQNIRRYHTVVLVLMPSKHNVRCASRLIRSPSVLFSLRCNESLLSSTSVMLSCLKLVKPRRSIILVFGEKLLRDPCLFPMPLRGKQATFLPLPQSTRSVQTLSVPLSLSHLAGAPWLSWLSCGVGMCKDISADFNCRRHAYICVTI